MLPSFNNHLAKIDSQLQESQQQLDDLETKEVHLKQIEDKVDEALNLLSEIVNELNTVDPEAVLIVKKELLSVLGLENKTSNNNKLSKKVLPFVEVNKNKKNEQFQYEIEF